MLRALVLLALGGCQLLFPLEGAPAAVDAPADAGPEPITGCSPLSLVASDFDDGQMPPWTNAFSNRFKVVNGALAVSLSSSPATTFTEPYFDLRGSAIQLHPARTPADVPGSATLELQLIPGASEIADSLTIVSTGMELTAGTTKGGVPNSLRTIPLDPAQVWRIREAFGTVHFEVGDGETFVDFQTIELPVTFVRPLLKGRADVVGPVTISFDDVNRGVSQGTPCSVVALADDFPAPSLDLQRWGRSSSNNCTISVADGVTLTPSQDVSWNCQVNATTEYDLLDHQLELDLVISGVPNYSIELTLLTPGNTRAGFRLMGGMLSSFKNTVVPNSPTGPGLGDTLASVSFDTTTHRLWRLRAVRDTFGEQLTFETSDGTTTVPFLSTGDLVGLDRVTVSLVVRGDVGSTSTIHLAKVSATRL